MTKAKDAFSFHAEYICFLMFWIFLPFIYFTSFGEQGKADINSLRWSAPVGLKPAYTRMWVAQSTIVLWALILVFSERSFSKCTDKAFFFYGSVYLVGYILSSYIIHWWVLSSSDPVLTNQLRKCKHFFFKFPAFRILALLSCEANCDYCPEVLIGCGSSAVLISLPVGELWSSWLWLLI